MLLKLVLILVTLAPVPAPPRPDPLGFGYLGVWRSDQVAAGGVVLGEVRDGQPAARAGLRAGDELVQIGRLKPKQFEEVVDYISGQRPGTALKVRVRRTDTLLDLTVVLGARPSDQPLPGLPGRGGPGRPQVLPVIPPPKR